MMAEKFKEGDIRPVYRHMGYEVCKKASDKEAEQIWISTESLSDAEILSFVFKSLKKKKE